LRLLQQGGQAAPGLGELAIELAPALVFPAGINDGSGSHDGGIACREDIAG
jgi:hypothetical protein